MLMSDVCGFLRDHPKCSYIKSWDLDSDSVGEQGPMIAVRWEGRNVNILKETNSQIRFYSGNDFHGTEESLRFCRYDLSNGELSDFANHLNAYAQTMKFGHNPY